jgi:hypothetical protein
MAFYLTAKAHCFTTRQTVVKNTKTPLFLTYIIFITCRADVWKHLLACLLTFLLSYSMEQSPSWQANRFAVSQEILRILGTTKVHYCIHKCPPPGLCGNAGVTKSEILPWISFTEQSGLNCCCRREKEIIHGGSHCTLDNHETGWCTNHVFPSDCIFLVRKSIDYCVQFLCNKKV